MTFTVTFTVGKRNYQVVKRAIWNVVNPIEVHFRSEKDSNGRAHLEATVTNICKHTLTIKDIKLVTPQDSTFQDPIYEPHKDVNGVCVLQPGGAYSVIFKNIKTTKPMQIKAFWHCYERGVGEIDMQVDVFNYEQPIAYETIQHPGTVSLNDEFTIKFRVTNTTQESLQCRLKFNQNQLKPLVVQVEDYLDFGGMAPAESKIIEVPFMSMEKGLHTIRGLELCVMPDLVIPVTDLQVLAV
ncbi:elongation factor Ts, putative [Babesia ovata]|uniref:Elongation factor Ts, putative n=1 Tax=Babesia ovata TaxID=189622 RepID=A0A2H6KFD9_9APIC|nr:elongation factor Ts, putative [Babesia ovata]GBE61705.1 elongation factor Ts, putative [Babesia ovata]